MRTLEEAKKEFNATNITEEQGGAITVITAEFERLIEHVFNEVPEGAHRTAGVRKLLEAKQTFTHAISHDWHKPKGEAVAKSA